jgi:hypothetical protein
MEKPTMDRPLTHTDLANRDPLAQPRDAAPSPDAGSARGGDVVNPSLEDAHWRAAWSEEPYARTDFLYEDYEPAYRLGYLGAAKRDGRTFEEAEPQLREQYERVRGGSPLQWHAARVPAKAAWDRVAAMPRRAD